MTPEMMKNNQELAAQAALRAQQIMFRKSIGSAVSAGSSPSPSPPSSKKSLPPVVPARGDSVLSKQPPEIPPKRHSLKKIDDHGNASSPSKQSMAPPPLPQKPSPAPTLTPVSLKKRNKTDRSVDQSQYGARIPGSVSSLPDSPVPLVKNAVAPNTAIVAPINISQNPFLNHSPPTQRVGVSRPAKKPVSPIEDFSSEDALRGIESGLRNMERAMQEQMNIRSAAAAVQHQQQQQQQQKQQHPKPSDKMNFNPIRSMERGFSMDQMRLDAMNLGSMRSTLEEMKSKGFVDMNAMTASNAPNTRPIENHMKSLDRNLPLELQYSRHHHHRSQSQQEIVEQMRHNLVNSGTGAGAAMMSATRQGGAAISRDDVRLRRRSSHDENQMSQSQANAAGKMRIHSISCFFPLLFIQYAKLNFVYPNMVRLNLITFPFLLFQ